MQTTYIEYSELIASKILVLNQEFLGSGEGSKSVREYLTKVGDDEVTLLRFLKGRKNRPKHAWETV